MTTLTSRDGARAVVTSSGSAEIVQAIPDGATDEYVALVLANAIRADRDKLLAKSDYLLMADYPIDDARRAAWAAYRQALRDIPDQAGFPLEVTWPVAPINT